jgi:hypothetical protein
MKNVYPSESSWWVSRDEIFALQNHPALSRVK